MAAFMPALVRSAISARSSCATAPSTSSENLPCGVEVSIGSRSERKCAPRSSSRSMTSSRWLTAGEAIEADDDENVAGGDFAHQLRQHWPGARGAGAVLLMDQAAAGRLELVDLGIGRLLLGGDAGITDEVPDRGN
jgi:hypothetical protein